MRALSDALKAEQRDANVNPCIKVVLTPPGAGNVLTYKTSDATTRIKKITSTEGLWGSTGQTEITLSNHDEHFSVKDLRGYKVEIFWGAITTGEEFSEQAPLWVFNQREDSESGICVTILECVDIWWRLSQLKVIGGGTKVAGTISGTFQLLEAVTKVSGGGNGSASHIVVIGDDYLILTGTAGTFLTSDVYRGATSNATITLTSNGQAGGVGAAPQFDGNQQIHDIIAALTADIADLDDDTGGADARIHDTPEYTADNLDPMLGIIRRLIEMTQSALRYENDEDMHLIYLNPTPATDYAYDSAHSFLVDIRDQRLVVPNKIFVIDVIPDFTYWAVANDTTSQAAIGIITQVFEAPDLTSNAEAQNRANALLVRIQQESVQGRVIAPMNCGQELLDYITITDSRAGITTAGRIGLIIRTFEPGTYTIECRLGGILDFLDISSPQAFMQSLYTYGYGRLTVPGGAITGPLISPSVSIDASQVPYTPAVLTDWDGNVDPGQADGALDQLAKRADDLEATSHAAVTLGGGSDAALALAGQQLTLADVLTPAEHTAIGDGAPHHAAVTLGAGSDAALALAGQQLTLADVLTPGEHTAIGDGAPHHAQVHGAGDHTDRTRNLFLPAAAFYAVYASPTLAAVHTSLGHAWLLDDGGLSGLELVGTYFIVPEDWGSGTISIKIYYTMAGVNTSKQVRWWITRDSFADGELMTTSTNDSGPETCPDAADTLDIIAWGSGVVVAAGEIIQLRVGRYGGFADDTASGDVQFLGLELEYTADM